MSDIFKTLEEAKAVATGAALSIQSDNSKRGEAFLSSVTSGDWAAIISVYWYGKQTFVTKDGTSVKRFSEAQKESLGLNLIKPMELSAIAKVADDWYNFVSHVSEVYEGSLNGEGDRLAYTSIRTAASDFKSIDAPEGIDGEDEEESEGSNDDAILKAKEALVKAIVKASKAGMDAEAIAKTFAEALANN